MFFMSLMCCKTIATFLWRSIDNFQSNFGTLKLFNKKSECVQRIYFEKMRCLLSSCPIQFITNNNFCW